MTDTPAGPAAPPSWTIHLLTDGPHAFDTLAAALPAGADVEQADDAIRCAAMLMQRNLGLLGAAPEQRYNVRIIGTGGDASSDHPRAVSIEVAEYAG